MLWKQINKEENLYIYKVFPVYPLFFLCRNQILEAESRIGIGRKFKTLSCLLTILGALKLPVAFYSGREDVTRSTSYPYRSVKRLVYSKALLFLIWIFRIGHNPLKSVSLLLFLTLQGPLLLVLQYDVHRSHIYIYIFQFCNNLRCFEMGPNRPELNGTCFYVSVQLLRKSSFQTHLCFVIPAFGT